MATPLINWLLGFAKKAKDWLGIRPENSEVNYYNSSEVTNINNLEGNIIININQSSPGYNDMDARELLSRISESIKNHEGTGLSIDNSIAIATKENLTQIQKNQIKLFKEANWSKEKIASIKIAYKVINLEDNAAYEDATSLMASAFNGPKRIMNRKFYNLARAGYLEGFSIRLLYGRELWSDEAIERVLEYFSDAIFIDFGMDTSKFILELEKREKENVRRVSIYARGNDHISDLSYFYEQYLRTKSQKVPERDTFYSIVLRQRYKIGSNEAVRVDLVLKTADTI